MSVMMCYWSASLQSPAHTPNADVNHTESNEPDDPDPHREIFAIARMKHRTLVCEGCENPR